MSAVTTQQQDWHLRELKRSLRNVNLRKQMAALALVAPLAIFIFLVFVMPVASMISRSIQSPEVVDALPDTTAALRNWDRKSAVPDDAFRGLMLDIERNGGNNSSGTAAGRLNGQKEGFRSLFYKTSSALPFGDDDSALPAHEVRQKLIEIDRRWEDPGYWQVIAKDSSRYTSQYLLATMDYRRNSAGDIVPVDPGASAYREVFMRTFVISGLVTLAALLLGYPLAYWISSLPAGKANLLMILVLLPFWTSILVRISAWIVILQGSGLVNKALLSLDLISSPLTLLFNRTGVLISMTHILLPFMILPLYSVMKSVPASYTKAAISLGSHPFGAFWKVYFPQTLPGVGAGGLLVFITALGYYITPALLGGAGDQMVSYYIAYFTNVALNWGMACALGAVLLLVTLILFGVYRKIVGNELKVG
ncbi:MULTISPECIES: ABC transporter permease [unclassified Paraburkholderia]|uniref:ABC transporter permease n=1 Tax=unclassified Paraburkholderia TaxID=2615204 RepID=UPI0016143FC4|nr:MULTISPECIES: ABC transporter permease [unclassified Paraburkholderia]MBB5412746.1 putative spermidine/putrescine transport system permease protein [Paraburkholderia sp. HC6.4b]MBB5454811.1 putative spermidine/putrescine transport system permease protein [Paraburkholderia sp. Kb1A]MBB5495945.1 putative spermidine/putrescine transport system permease protein [Paraburkholderia sp. MM5384-R2]